MTGPAPKLLPLRIRLPYTGEEEFIERYGSNVGRGGVFVATRALKPEGTGLAFEFVLADGTRLLRGEGVVLKAQPDAGSARTGMTVRFTKLDAASKALIDRIVARRSGMEVAPPGLVRRTPAVNPARPASGIEAPAPVEPPAKVVLEKPGTRAAPPKASMTLPAVKLPVAEPPPDLAEPDDPVSLFPEHAVDEEEELAPLPSVDFLRKPRRRPAGLDPQRATQEMFTVQPTTPASRGVQAADASTTPEADGSRVEAQPAAADGDASVPDAREDEALPPATEASGAPDAGEASAHHFTPASVDAFDPNAVLGAAHAPEHSGWSPEYATEETGDTASEFADTPGAAEPAHVEAAAVSVETQADSGSSFDFDVDLSMESDESPAPAEPGPQFAPDSPATEDAEDATLPPGESSWAPSEAPDAVSAQEPLHSEASSEWRDPDSDTEGASFAATVPSEEDDARTVSASDAEGGDTEAALPPAEHLPAAPDFDAAEGSTAETAPAVTDSDVVEDLPQATSQPVGFHSEDAPKETPPPPEPFTTPSQREAERLRAWGIDPDSLPRALSTDSEDVDPFSAALEQAVGATDTDEPERDTQAVTTSTAAPTASSAPVPEPVSAPPMDEEDASTVVVVELPTEDAWTALVGSSASEDTTPAVAAPAVDASPELESASVQAPEHDEALASVLAAGSHEETRSASPVAPPPEETPPPTVSTPAALDASNALAADTKLPVEESAPLQVSTSASASPVASGEATQHTAANAPSGTEAAALGSTAEEPSPRESAVEHEDSGADSSTSEQQPAASETTAQVSTPSQQASATEQPPRSSEATSPISATSEQPSPQAPAATEPPRASEAATRISTGSEPQPPQASAATESPRASEAAATLSAASEQPNPQASAAPESSRSNEAAALISAALGQASAETESPRSSEATAPSTAASEQPNPQASAAPESPRTSEAAATISTAAEQPNPQASVATESSRSIEATAPVSAALGQASAATESPRSSEANAPTRATAEQPNPQASVATETPRSTEATASVLTASSPPPSQTSTAPQSPRTDEAAPPPSADAQSSTATARSRRRTLFDLAPAVPVTTPAAAEVVLGIDVGTSHARVAAFIDGVATPIPIPGNDGSGLPSVIAVNSAGEFLVGAAALVEASRAPRRAATGLKRLLGVRARSPNLRWLSPQLPFPVATDRHGDAGVELDGRHVAPTLLTAMLLRELHQAATTHLGRKVTRAVLCAPSHFTERQRAALREAATMAGLDVPRVLTNSAAAALAYAYGRGLARKRVLVVDLGGGGLEVCVVQVTGDDLEVVTTGGDPTLGGMDFDARIAEALVSDLAGQGHPRPEHLLDWGPLRTLAESTKETLSTQDSVDVTLPTGPGPKLDRERMEALTADLAQRVVSVTREVLESNALSPQGLDAVLLVGGQSRSPLVRRRLEESLGVPVRDDGVDARTAVVRGAALLGHALLLSETGKPAASVSEVLTAPIGVAEDAGTFRRVLERNTRLPTAKTLVIPITVPGPLALAFFQGTAATAVENEWLGCLTLSVERPGEVEVHLELSTDGTLAFSATLPGAKRQPVTLAAEELDDASRDALIARSPFHTEPEARPSGLLSGLKKLFGRR
ncbi:TIGR02266 family protein [Corallococcus exiguus]|uniref:TIGR02266 family protein n=1 Tax=Corallococcus exiguus TaxID=83462 RepID=UPI0020163D2B|nr:TIGR02266 family protein [Corallococcus exiguus]